MIEAKRGSVCSRRADARLPRHGRAGAGGRKRCVQQDGWGGTVTGPDAAFGYRLMP